MEEMTHSHEMTRSMTLPPHTKLHIVLHGLIGVRLSRANRTAQLLIPSVPMHVYHYGSFPVPRLHVLQTGHDYQLGGVQVGHFEADADAVVTLKNEHLAICLDEHNLGCVARGTHATITLPWPNDIQGVRHMLNPHPPKLFPGSGVNPANLYYVTYLTYLVYTGDHPVLTKCCRKIWKAPNESPLPHHVRLHFFADPETTLPTADMPAHVADAYSKANDQLFGGKFLLKPDTSEPWNYSPESEHTGDVPTSEAVDFSRLLKTDEPELRVLGTGGNCLPPLILD